MARLLWFEDHSLLFHCPGCGHAHSYRIKPDPDNAQAPVWTWNQSMEQPTFRASLLNQAPYPDGMRICHLYVTDGKIEYLNDCTHELAGQTIEMVNA